MTRESRAQPIRNPLLEECRARGAGPALLEKIRGATEEELLELAAAVDESPYPLSEWAEAFIRFEAWQEECGRPIPLGRMREYLGCCIEGANSPVPLLPLPELLARYLQSHGVA